MKLNFQKLDIEIPVEIPVNFMISTGTGIPANRLILTGTGILPGSRSILGSFSLFYPNGVFVFLYLYLLQYTIPPYPGFDSYTEGAPWKIQDILIEILLI